MTRQIPAERPLENKQQILDRVLADADDAKPRRRAWLLPVAAAASIAVVATGALTVPSLFASDKTEPAGTQSSGTPRSAAATRPAGAPVSSIDRGTLSPAQTTAFGTECGKWIGSKDIPGQTFGDAPLNWPGAGAKIDKILHATKIAGRKTGVTDWTVAVRSGGRTYGCVGQPPTQDSAGRAVRNYEWATFERTPHDGLGGTGSGLAVTGSHSTARMSTGRWVVGPATATQVQVRILRNGKAGPWFSTDVTDGLAYIRTPESAPLKVGDKLRVETRLLDQTGKQLGKLHVENHKVVRFDGFVSVEPDQN